MINKDVTVEELLTQVGKLKSNKLPGINNILNEFIKYCPRQLLFTIVTLFNIILNSSVIPTPWTIAIIKPIYKKKGNINNVNSYRGITLLSCVSKLFTSLLNQKMYNFLPFKKY